MNVYKPTVFRVEFDENEIDTIHKAFQLVDDIVGTISNEKCDGLYEPNEAAYFSLDELKDISNKLYMLHAMLAIGELEIE